MDESSIEYGKTDMDLLHCECHVLCGISNVVNLKKKANNTRTSAANTCVGKEKPPES